MASASTSAFSQWSSSVMSYILGLGHSYLMVITGPFTWLASFSTSSCRGTGQVRHKANLTWCIVVGLTLTSLSLSWICKPSLRRWGGCSILLERWPVHMCTHIYAHTCAHRNTHSYTHAHPHPPTPTPTHTHAHAHPPTPTHLHYLCYTTNTYIHIYWPEG